MIIEIEDRFRKSAQQFLKILRAADQAAQGE